MIPVVKFFMIGFILIILYAIFFYVWAKLWRVR